MRKTILVVDDDPTLLSLLVKILLSKGYAVLQAEHGQAALLILTTHNVDLLITNKKMAPVDGIQLLKIVRQKYPDLPAIMLTAYPTVATIYECDNAGVFDYMAKPFKIDSLLQTISHALTYGDGKSSINKGPIKPELIDALIYRGRHIRDLLRNKAAMDLK